MILEGIVTSTNEEGSVNISPMGPAVDLERGHIVLRPFSTSQTCANLRRNGHAVFHVVDDVALIVNAAIHRLETPPPLVEREGAADKVIADACRWYSIEVREIDDSEPRIRFDCEVVARGRLRDFFGFNRAKHAVLEGAILATRITILPYQEIQDQIEALSIIVEKTAGPQETEAFQVLRSYIEEHAPRNDR